MKQSCAVWRPLSLGGQVLVGVWPLVAQWHHRASPHSRRPFLADVVRRRPPVTGEELLTGHSVRAQPSTARWAFTRRCRGSLSRRSWSTSSSTLTIRYLRMRRSARSAGSSAETRRPGLRDPGTQAGVGVWRAVGEWRALTSGVMTACGVGPRRRRASLLGVSRETRRWRLRSTTDVVVVPVGRHRDAERSAVNSGSRADYPRSQPADSLERLPAVTARRSSRFKWNTKRGEGETLPVKATTNWRAQPWVPAANALQLFAATLSTPIYLSACQDRVQGTAVRGRPSTTPRAPQPSDGAAGAVSGRQEPVSV